MIHRLIGFGDTQRKSHLRAVGVSSYSILLKGCEGVAPTNGRHPLADVEGSWSRLA
jgi:hypothetical protein